MMLLLSFLSFPLSYIHNKCVTLFVCKSNRWIKMDVILKNLYLSFANAVGMIILENIEPVDS